MDMSMKRDDLHNSSACYVSRENVLRLKTRISRTARSVRPISELGSIFGRTPIADLGICPIETSNGTSEAGSPMRV